MDKYIKIALILLMVFGACSLVMVVTVEPDPNYEPSPLARLAVYGSIVGMFIFVMFSSMRSRAELRKTMKLIELNKK